MMLEKNTGTSSFPIQELLDQLDAKNLNELSTNFDNFLSKVYSLLVLFLSNDLTPQQRQIWFELSMQHPKTLSGLEIAGAIGASKISKGIYQSIRVLEERNLIRIHTPHPRAFAIQANESHSMSALLIELCKYYGTF